MGQIISNKKRMGGGGGGAGDVISEIEISEICHTETCSYIITFHFVCLWRLFASFSTGSNHNTHVDDSAATVQCHI